MPSEYHDANQLPATLVTQATPFLYQSPGVLCSSGGTNLSTGSPGSAYIASAINIQTGGPNWELSTQDNNGCGMPQNLPWLTTVSYGQAESGKFPPANGVVRS